MKKIVLNYDELTGTVTDKNGLWVGCNMALIPCEGSTSSAPAGISGEDIAKIIAAALHPSAAERIASK